MHGCSKLEGQGEKCAHKGVVLGILEIKLLHLTMLTGTWIYVCYKCKKVNIYTIQLHVKFVKCGTKRHDSVIVLWAQGPEFGAQYTSKKLSMVAHIRNPRTEEGMNRQEYPEDLLDSWLTQLANLKVVRVPA